MIRTTDCRYNLISFSSSVPAPSTSSPPPWKKIPAPSSSRNPNSYLHQRCYCKRPDPNWYSNAESVRTGRFRFSEQAFDEDNEEIDSRFRRRKKRSWWSDDSFELDEEPELFDDDSNPFDRIWIVKVFQSYGWMLPAIIVSMLLATGPKAFLMALALPLGQSALSLAVDKMWGTTRDAPKRTSKARKKPFAKAASNAKREDKASDSGNKGRSGFQSWVETGDNVVEKDVSQRRPSFGGWDELDRRGESKNGPARPPSQTKGRAPRPQPEKKGKLTRGGRFTGVPLLLRLLIAVFPFLGSWTRIL